MLTVDVDVQPTPEPMQPAPAARLSAIPERIAPNWRPILAGADAAVVFLVALVALNGGNGSRIAAAVAMAAVICGIFWLCGFYRRSYAVYPRDEIYYACAGVLFAAVPVGLVLSAVGDLPTYSVVIALIFAAVGTSAARVRIHMERRPDRDIYAGIPAVTYGAWHDREQAYFDVSKRIFDTAAAALALLLFSPVMLAAAAAIYRESGGPIFFRQDRVGKNGRVFRIFKFRTMRVDAGDKWAKPGDDRITRTGAFLRRTSLDELPQLFNVLRGEMSIVGPRPEMASFASEFARALPSYTQRSIVAPGITGWAQVYLKRNLQPADQPDVLPYDLFYVEHSTVLLDTAIVLKTAAEVLFHRAV
ncbi:MAG TPA: sugar transferase [Candidatus Baltobacteraceae bacterium]|nr:sugar transferase [Candidatus Baltobacteraceae bacterium]